MAISDKYRKTIVKEIEFAVGKMEETQNPEKKLYYFSGVYAITQRIFNLEYDSNLVFVHFILQQTHRNFIERLQTIQKGKEETVPLHEEQFARLTALTKELGDNISAKKDINSILKRLSELALTTTGNGYYLMQKGLLKI